MNTLTAGKSYNFQLASSYLFDALANVYGTASVLITINSPPTGGYLIVNPTVGVALNTSFLFTTALWIDEISDYPLSYTFFYYISSDTNLVILRENNIYPYASSTLGQGLKSLNYKVTCLVKVYDIYNGTSNSTYLVTVNTISITFAISNSLSLISNGLSNQNAARMLQAIGNALHTVNTVDCTVPISCSILKRQTCTFTSKTCGACLDGYVGIYGDTNLPCNLENKVLSI
jgi:hypothetical protein